jgi:hypothetical protein
LFGDFNYTLGIEDSAVADNQVLKIDVVFGLGELVLNSLETGAVYEVFAGDGDDVIDTGGGNDIISAGDGLDTIAPGRGRDTVDGGNGEDRFVFFRGDLTRKDRIEGGDTTEVNTVVLNGDYSDGVTLGAETFTHIEVLEVTDGSDYVVDLGKTTANVQFFGVDALSLGAGSMIDFDGSRILGGASFNMRGGAGDDRFIGAGNGDRLTGNLGADRLEGGGGPDFYQYLTVADSTGADYDTVVGFDTDDDLFIISPGIGVAVQAIDAKVTDGKLSDDHFNGDLEDAIGAGELASSHAVVFQPDQGTLDGQTFVIVDCNFTAGYQRGEDLVIRLVNALHLGNLAASDFFTI